MKIKQLCVSGLLLLAAVTASAQMEMPKIPVDPAVRMGKLDNGLTYYVRHNEWPENVVNFYIAQRVGAIQEEESQRGLAHFLEHMAFNGSEHFAGNGIIEFTRSLGVSFGGDLNAYTGIDQTVYRICNVPSKRITALDSCLLVLRDWSCGLTIDSVEIDKERDVIHNEWRLGEGPSQRMIQSALPKIYPNSKYGVRMPIGLMSVIDNFAPQTLRDYYHLWYRADNQAIIVVGDIDVDRTEAKIKEMFSNITVDPNAPKVIAEQVPDNAEPIYVFEKDKEMRMNQILVYMKHDAPTPEERGTLPYLMQKYVTAAIGQMFNQRFNELSQDPECPFLQAGGEDGVYLLASTKDAFQLVGIPKEGKDMQTLTAIMKEARRVAQFGFTATEYARAQADILANIEKQYTNRNKITNDAYGDDMRDHFLKGEPMPAMEDYYQMMQQLIPAIPVEAINQVAKQLIPDNDTNLVVMEWAREADGLSYPTEADMKAAVAAARAAQVEAYVDNVKNEPLMANLPKAGKIVKETTNDKFGYKELTLSNGAKVILKSTDYKDDEVQMNAYAMGGKSLFGEADYSNLKLFDDVMSISGLANFSSTELTKALAGKNVNVNPSMGLTRQYMTGHSTPKDLETLFQLTYLYFTAVSKDEKQYTNLMNQLGTVLKNKSLSPDLVFQDSLTNTINNHDPRFATIDMVDLPKISYDRIIQIWKERYANAGQFTFMFVGKFDEAAIRPLIEQYIASLPAKKGKADKFRDVRQVIKGEVSNHFIVKSESPKATAVELWQAFAANTLENKVKADVLGEVLSMVYLKTIREEESAAYSCGAAGGVNLSGTQPLIQIQAYCPMNPDKQELALKLLHKGMADAAVSIDPDMLAKVKENLVKDYDLNVKKNGYWVNTLTTWKDYGLDTHTDYRKVVEAITPEDISAFAKNVVLASGNHAEVVMKPEVNK